MPDHPLQRVQVRRRRGLAHRARLCRSGDRPQSLDLEEYWLEIGRLEKAGDKSFRRIISKLFSGNYDALEVLKLKDVVEKLEGAINAFETVAKRVEQIAVKES